MAGTDAEHKAFSSPFEVPIPPPCEGWQEMYAYHVVFSEDRRDFDEGRFWIQDGLHCAEPLYPLDAAWLDCGVVALNQASARLFAIPPSLGIEYRVLNGYFYFNATTVTDEATLAGRAELFAKRGGYYYEHWEQLYAQWREKVEAAIRELEAIAVPDLPEFEDETIVTEGRGLGSSHALLVAYDRMFEGFDRIWQYHFELLNLGYGAYLAFYALCRQAFPEIPDQSVAKMVSGADVLALRPDDELRRLARLALELGVAGGVEDAVDEATLKAALGESDAGARWLADYEDTKHPWFHFSYGNGLYHHHRSWIDDTTLPIATIASYIGRLQAGDDISRPKAAVIRERDRMTAEYRSLIPEDTREAFDEQLALARTVFSYVEDHTFYIEHWYLADLLEQGARVRGAAGSVRVRRGAGRRLLPASRRAARGSRGTEALLELRGRRGRPGPHVLAADRRQAEGDLPRNVRVGSARSAWPAARGNHRADHAHALRRQHGAGPGMA